jgi:peptidyl-tRNA hydrolase
MTKKGVYTTGIFRNHQSWDGTYDLAKWCLKKAEEEQQYCCKIRVMQGEYKLVDICVTIGDNTIVVKVGDTEYAQQMKDRLESRRWAVKNLVDRGLTELYG